MLLRLARAAVTSHTEPILPQEGIMAKGQVQRGNTNKAKLTAKEKAKKKLEKKAKAAKF